MVSVDAAARLARKLPDVTTGAWHGNRTWQVGGKAFAWLRPFSKADVRRFGDAAVPAGPILAVRTASLADKDAVLAARTRGVFTIPHFDGYAAVLIRLDVVGVRVLQRLLQDAWLACAPVAGAGLRVEAPRRRKAAITRR
jgi:hypothetical protein